MADIDIDPFRDKPDSHPDETGETGGEGVMTLHDYGYLSLEFLKSYPVSK